MSENNAAMLEVESWDAVLKEQKEGGVPEKYAGLKTKSDIIRAMHKDGYKTGAIAKMMGIRYQHARNVIKQPLKRA